jgi:PAS domain S-box-containing protein
MEFAVPAKIQAPLEGRLLNAFADHSEEAMARVKLNGTITAWNPAMEKMFGLDKDEAVGANLIDRMVPDDLRQEREMIMKRVRGGDVVESETRRIRADGAELLVAIRVIPVCDDSGQVVEALWTARDITDRRLREAQENFEAEESYWRGRIDEALAADGFALFGQPVVDLYSGEVRHHELLLRMADGEGGWIGPFDFLPVAERSGQIRRIDRWVVTRAVEVARRFPVAVNVSGLSLADVDLATSLAEAIERHRVRPGDVTVEITETAASEDVPGAVRFTEALAALGCGVAIDDFGTGYGSFTYLHALPVSELKIDKQFISGLSEERLDRRVVDTMVTVGRNFGATVVAEGIEDADVLEAVRRLGVRLGQGYLLGRPAPVEEIEIGARPIPGARGDFSGDRDERLLRRATEVRKWSSELRRRSAACRRKSFEVRVESPVDEIRSARMEGVGRQSTDEEVGR